MFPSESGCAPLIFSAMADWTSDMVSRYGRKLMLNPSMVEPVKFYNPVSLKHSYGALGNGLNAESAATKAKS